MCFCIVFVIIDKDCSINETIKGVLIISRLADVRKDRGLTQETLSELSGVHRVTIARYESGVTSPTIRTLEKLAKQLGVPVEDLIDRKGA